MVQPFPAVDDIWAFGPLATVIALSAWTAGVAVEQPPRATDPPIERLASGERRAIWSFSLADERNCAVPDFGLTRRYNRRRGATTSVSRAYSRILNNRGGVLCLSVCVCVCRCLSPLVLFDVIGHE